MVSIASKSTRIRIFENLHKKCEKLKWNQTWYKDGKSRYCATCVCWFEASKYHRCPCCNRLLRGGRFWKRRWYWKDEQRIREGMSKNANE